MGKGGLRALSALFVSFAVFVAAVAPGVAQVPSGGGGDTPTLAPGHVYPIDLLGEEENADRLLEANDAYVLSRTAGNKPISIEQAAALRIAAANQRKLLKNPSGPATFTGAWSPMGPNPTVQVGRSDGSFITVSGRIGALAIRRNGQIILGAAQGGIWLWNSTSQTWSVTNTDTLPALAIGALAVAPSDDNIVYAGTGEGALSGDSYYGNGILKSTDGGATWANVSGDYFFGVSTARLAVDPSDASHVYAAILRGRGGARRVSPPIHSAYGLWESHDGGASWALIKPTPAGTLGATDVRVDPVDPHVVYASFWGDKIYKSTDSGATWNPIMNGLPAGDFAASLSRFSLGLSHPASAAHATLYTGFDWFDLAGDYHEAHVFKSSDDGANWAQVPDGSGRNTVFDYCGPQCFYDNVIEADPTDPNVVFVGGNFGYNMSPQSGGIFRSVDGGNTWKNLGWNQHPDFHALAFDPTDTNKVIIGNDGGVWYSTDRGGRNATGALLSAVTWQDLNGSVDPASAAVTHRTNLQITQFSSIGVVPQLPNRFWGGTQDNGTQRKSSGSNTWFDVAGGDGGQVQVDQSDPGDCGLGACFVYGTYDHMALYRYTDGGGFGTNGFIMNGINRADRVDFYMPVVLNQLSTNQLLIGSYRVYRTDNAREPLAGDVQFKAISPDLTSGCAGTAPNGARACVISAIGVGGGSGVYTGSEDGLVYFSANGLSSDKPTWVRRDLHSLGVDNKHSLPARPVAWIAVDRSDYRVAYVAFNGYNAATPTQPGHVFMTTTAGAHWTDISGNLPDNPVNSLVIDPSYPNTLYAATDVGPFATYNGGATWSRLGTGFPSVAVNQIDMNTFNRTLAAGTHGRGAFRITDGSAAAPALVISKADAGVPVGPGSNLDYTITVRNIGNADATGVKITDPTPVNTSFVSADSGGANVSGVVTWTGKSIAAGDSISVHLTVQINPGVKNGVNSIVDQGFKATSAQGPSANGSPTVTPLAPSYGVSISPATQTGGAHTGASQSYTVTVKNLGFHSDSFNMSATGTYAVSFFDATCTTPQTQTATLAPGASADVCVKVTVPNGAADGDSDTSTIKATSATSPTVSATATIVTIAVTVDTLLVDGDGNGPDVSSYYKNALAAAGVSYDYWDLSDPNKPQLAPKYLQAFKHVVWFTGNSYPGPITPYERLLTAYLNNGGHLFLSGQDLLDQGAGTSDFVHNYLHVDWDGSESQNDKHTDNVTAVAGTLSDGDGTVPVDHSVLGNSFEDQITPIDGATAIFTDDTGAADGLSFSGTYKVVFLAFPFEEYGTAAQKGTLAGQVFSFFGS